MICVHSFVGIFIPRKDRLKDMGQNIRFTNLYIKNFPEEMNNDGLAALFADYGKILSAVVIKDNMNGKSKGYGFVSFDEHMSAATVSAMCSSIAFCMLNLDCV